MTAAEAIAMLDGQLVAHGTSATLRRVGSPNVDAAVRAWITSSQPAADGMLGGDIVQFDKAVVLSPSDLSAWPGAAAQTDGTDVKVPRPHDLLIVAGRAHAVVSADPRYVAGTLVRINLVVRG